MTRLAEGHYQIYRGLSGIDSASLALLMVTMLRQARRERRHGRVAVCLLVCLAFVGKVGYAAMTGTALFVNGQARQMLLVPLAHAVGAALGIGAACTRLHGEE